MTNGSGEEIIIDVGDAGNWRSTSSQENEPEPCLPLMNRICSDITMNSACMFANEERNEIISRHANFFKRIFELCSPIMLI